MGMFLDYEHFQECSNCGSTRCNGNECRRDRHYGDCGGHSYSGRDSGIPKNYPFNVRTDWDICKEFFDLQKYAEDRGLSIELNGYRDGFYLKLKNGAAVAEIQSLKQLKEIIDANSENANGVK